MTVPQVAAVGLGLWMLLACGCNGSDEGLLAAPADGKADAGQSRPANRLARETSPYLLQHAHNPVDWYPWGPEAFEAARKDGKLIFLSVGYSSCHWCHVMERLVFENEAIAAAMNEHFVCIKVDREERPDVDDIYMTALQVYFQAVGSDQGGGWPLSMFLTPEGKPIAGGTYFPPEDKPGRMGFPTVMRLVHKQWKEQRDGVERQADVLARETQRVMRPQLVLNPTRPGRKLVAAAAQALTASHDPQFGGVDFDPAQPDEPKFPVPAKLALLLYEADRHDNADAAKVLHHTLDQLAAGGIHDHLGGGFHRYSTDRRWRVPHFEKMLYDQAQLADLYTAAFRRTQNPTYREAAEGIFAFVARELTDPRGGFYSALDAETDGVEGKFYVWSKEEVAKILAEDADLFQSAYGMNGPQEFEHGYVLHRTQPLDELAAARQIPADELRRRLDDMRRKLLDARNRRTPLRRDDKILTSWNGLMIRALARAGQALGRADYTQAAARAAEFVLTHMRDEQGQLHRTHRGGKSSLNGYLDDYAFLVEGLLALHATTRDPKWLNAARRLTDEQIALFWDEQGKGFFFTSHGHEALIARTKNAWDAVIPSGNAVSVRNLLQLAALTGDEKYRRHAEETLNLFAPALQQSPSGMATLALAMGEALDAGLFAAAEPAAPPQPAEHPEPMSENELPPAENREGVIQQVAGEAPAKKAKDARVLARAFLSVDRLPAGGECRVVMFLKVQEGWHINANPAHPENLIATTFTLDSPKGVELTDLRYPAAEELTVEGFDEPLHVYEGRVAIYGTLKIPADARGADRMELRVRYQACNDQNCEAPKTVKLIGSIPIAAPGEPVKQTNEQLFPPVKK